MTKKLTLSVLLLITLFSCNQTPKEIDLKGEWHFQIDSLDKGINEKWYDQTLPETINLPGSMASNGKGNDISINTQWTGSLFDKSWYTAEKYAKYRQPDNIKVPFWLQPVKKYTGAAWYQKEITIPKDWSNKKVTLFLERCHWETKVWVDDKYAGMQNSLGTPHEHDLSSLFTPGKHRISILVDNRIKDINPGINAHSITDHTQTNWNGIIGEIKLITQPQTAITEIKLFPNIENKTVKAHITISNSLENSITGIVKLSAKSKIDKSNSFSLLKREINITPGENTFELEYKIGDNVKLWDEFNPNLYFMNVVLSTDEGVDKKSVQFGMCSFETKGTRFTVNGRPTFLRGTLECAVFPKTGYPATDLEEWTRILKTIKAHGLNHIRFHSWCPPEAAFNAADELGIYLQVECSSWANMGVKIGDGKPLDKWIYKESESIIKNFGNHPSFCLFAYGNEPSGKHYRKYLSDFLRYWKAKDNRRVYTGSSGWSFLEENDYNNSGGPRIQHWTDGLNSIINAFPPKTTYDWRDIISKWNKKPYVSHEIGQWCAYPDFKEIKEYSGVLKAKNFEIFRETLENNHMGELADSFLLASGKLQALCYKADIEAALRTPGFAGFQLLGLSDFPGQGTALVGVLNAFWEEKGYITPKQYSRFCNSTVPIARLKKRVFTNDETFNAEIEVSSFEEEPLKSITPTWKITGKDNKTLWSGELPQVDILTDNCQSLGEVSVSLNSINKPQKLTLEVSTGNYTNSWDFWVYPAFQPTIIPSESNNTTKVKVTQKLNQKTIEFLKNGGTVILTPPKGSVNTKFGGDIGVGFSSIFWNTSWTNGLKPHTMGILCNPNHPALSEFPTEYHSNWQWWDAMSHSNAIILDSFPVKLQPIVRVIDDWFKNRRLALIFEAKVGNGKLIVSGIDLLTNIENRPEAKQMLYSLKKYAASSSLNPTVELTVEQIKDIFK